MTIPFVAMNSITNGHVNFNRIWTAEEFGLEAEHFFIKTEDGLNISTYEVAVDTPKAVIICLSGIHNPSATIYFGHARLFKDHHFATILFDMRAHGESDGNKIYVGYKEWLDVKAIVKYIKEKPLYDNVPIIVFGLSMGGATAINSMGRIADIDSCSIKPPKEIVKLKNRPALLMHSKDDSQIPYKNFEILLKHAPPHVETFIRDGDMHFIVENFEYPEKDKEYSEIIIQFINKSL
jgi:fermentation-respiration switch protein FrsA (DUF1100 family)